MIEILIVDDQKTVQEILRNYLDGEPGLKIIDSADNGQVALDLVEAYRPDLVLMDIDMPVIDGLTVTRIITERFVETKVLILSVHDDDTYLNSALQVGAKGYLLKNTPAKELVNAIYSAYKGYFQLGPGLLEKYLYKIGTSQTSRAEVNQIKQMIEQQAKLLEQMQNKDYSKNNYTNQYVKDKYNGKDDYNRRYIALEKQVYALQYRFAQLYKKFVRIQNFCFFMALGCVVVLFMILLLSI